MFCCIRLDDEDVGLFGNDLMVGDWIGFQKKELSAHLSKDEME